MEKMSGLMKRAWWVQLLRGILAVIFGLIILVWPKLALEMLIVVFGVMCILDGSVLVAELVTRKFEGWALMLISSVISIVVGILVFVYPGLTLIILVYIAAARALLTGIFEVIAGVHLKKVAESGWMLVFAGIMSILFAIILFVKPIESLVVLISILAIFAIIFGALLIVLAFRVKAFSKDIEKSGV